MSCFNAHAQIPKRTPGKFPSTNNNPNDPSIIPPAQNEITGEVDKTREKSNTQNYDSKGKGRFTADFIRWYNENSPFKPKPIPLQNPTHSGHGSSLQDFFDQYSSSSNVATPGK